jgi:hypothetical protein
VGFWLVSSVRQAFNSYLDEPLNGETVPQTTAGTQPLALNKNTLEFILIYDNMHCTLYTF